MYILFYILVPAGPHFPEFWKFRGISGIPREQVGIESFQGKFNLRDLYHNTIWYHTTILLQFATPFNVACGAWSAIAVVSADSRRTPPVTSPNVEEGSGT